jgi:hypothetical protein
MNSKIRVVVRVWYNTSLNVLLQILYEVVKGYFGKNSALQTPVIYLLLS